MIELANNVRLKSTDHVITMRNDVSVYPNLLLDHLTELPVVQLVIPAGIELAEGHLDLVIREVGADSHELLR